MKDLVTVFAGKEMPIKIPQENLIGVVEGHNLPPLDNPQQKLREILDKPIGCDKLVDLAKKGDKVALMTSEYMRMPYTWILAPVVVDILKEAGVKDKDITLVNAPGTHQTEAEQAVNPQVREVYGPLQGKHRLIMHDCDKREDLAYMGMTPQGTPVWVNKAVAEADLKIGFGELSPHHAAGHCGGGKIINPGVCGRATIGSMHRFVMSAHEASGLDLWQVGLHDERNPLRKDIEDTATVAGLDFKIDAVTNCASRELVGIFAGDFKKEYREGIKLSDSIYGTKTKKADIAVTLTPAVKGWGGGTYLTGAFLGGDITGSNAVKDDGIVIQVVSAEEGYSSLGTHRVYTPENMAISGEEMTWKLTVGDCDLRDMSLRWQVKRCLEETRAFLVTTLDEKTALSTGYAAVYRSFDEALSKAFQEKGKNAKVVVIDRAGRPNYPLPT